MTKRAKKTDRVSKKDEMEVMLALTDLLLQTEQAFQLGVTAEDLQTAADSGGLFRKLVLPNGNDGVIAILDLVWSEKEGINDLLGMRPRSKKEANFIRPSNRNTH